MSLMAMIYFIFASVNSMTYYALTSIQTFFAILERLSSILEMDEYVTSRKIDVPKEKVHIVMK